MKIDNTVNIKIIGTDCIKLNDKSLQSGILSLQESVARELYIILKTRFEPIQPYVNPTPSWPNNWPNGIRDPVTYTGAETNSPLPKHPVTIS